MWFNLFAILPLIWGISAAPQNKMLQSEIIQSAATEIGREKDDLKTAASSYSRQYSDWGGSSPGGYGYSVTGFGVRGINDKYDLNYGGVAGSDKSYQNVGYPGYSGNTGAVGNTGYIGGGRPVTGMGYIGNTGPVSGTGYSGYNNYGGYNPNAFEGNGGYGGYGGNGGLNSYSGYNNPYYQGSNHLGYGYYNKRPGFGGNIYNSGITPSYVTGYRGYTRR